MSKTLKIILIILGSIVALLVAAVIIIPMVVSPDFLKPKITEAVRDQTGRELTIAGDMSLSLFPWIGVSIEQVSLSNAPGFGEKPMAAINEAEVRVKLLPLISKKVEIGKVVLDGLMLNLAKNAQGVTNWDDLTKAKEAPPTEAPKPETPPKESSGGLGMDVTIDGVEVQNANISYVDAQADTSYALENLNVTTGALTLGQSFPLTVSYSFDSKAPVAQGSFTMQSQIFIEQAEQRITLAGTDLTLNLEKFAANAEAEPLSGTFSLKGDVKAAYGQGQASVNGLIFTAEAQGEALPGGKADAKLTADVNVDWKAGTLDVSTMSLTAKEATINGNIKGSGLMGEAPVITADLEMPPFSPKKLMQSLEMEPPETSDPNALTSLSGRLGLKAGKTSAQVTTLDIQLDQSTLKGTAGVDNFEQPAITFDLSLDKLDADRYLAKSAKEETGKEIEEAAKEPEKEAPEAEEKDPYEAVRKLDVDGKLAVGDLKAYGLELTNILLDVTAKNGVVNVKPFKTQLYGGNLVSSLMADVSGKEPKTALGVDLKSLSLAPFLNALAGTDVIGGDTKLDMNVSTQGTKLFTILRHLSGTASMGIDNGYVKGFNLSPGSFTPGKGYVGASGANQARTEFESLSASFDIKEGVAKTKDLLLKTAQGSVKGGGSVDLAKQGLATDFTANLGELQVPITVGGTFTDPKVSIDAEAMVTQAVKNLGKDVIKDEGAIQEKAGKLLNKEEGETGKVLEGIGKSLFGGGKKQ